MSRAIYPSPLPVARETLYGAGVADDNARQGEDFDVIPSLMDVLSEAMKKRDREAIELAPAMPRHKRTLGDYLKRKRMPPGENIEAVVAAVSVLTDQNRFALWDAAVKKAEERAKRLGDDPRMHDAEAALSAPDPESE